MPWVPAGGKNGIGATLTIHDMYGEFLILGSGYVSVKNRALWTKNARPKKLKIQYKKTGIVKYVDLKDTPDLQTIVMYTDEDYKNQTRGGDIVITIIDVYEGTTYSDVWYQYFGRKDIKDLILKECRKKFLKNIK
ncbi:NADase-type glycan-binding domain-containing protein [Treponema socranskii]|uniref:NADase-type glycan-binding domain-containing protein n=1 Tax=Treponema socranskii TaxID=53419 RepID=UPI003D8C11E4